MRGVVLDASAKLEDLKTGVRADHTGTMSSGVPGVTRESFVRRSGEGLDGPDRQLRNIGMRLVGGAAFVSRVRAK